MPRTIVLRRFPIKSFIFLTSAPCDLVSELVSRKIYDFAKDRLRLAAVGSSANLLVLTHRNRSVAVVPSVIIVATLVTSARGTNLHVRVGSGWLWPTIVLTLATLTAAGFLVSYAWREFLFAPWFALAALAAAIHHILSVGKDVEDLFNASLPE